MCYSAMLEASWREYEKTFSAQVDWEAFLQIFHARETDLSIKIASGIGEGLIAGGGPFTAELERSIAIWRPLETQRLEAELKKIDQAIAELEPKKPGKTRDKNLASRRRNRIKIQGVLDAHLSGVPDYRVWPAYFAPVLVELKGQRLITPMRYRVIPRYCPELSGMYNAKRTSLRTAKPWLPIFGKLHAVFFFERFFERVDRAGVSTEISFKPEGHPFMWAPALYEETERDWGVMRSFAIVTDDPPPEVAAAGHNRCPIFLDRTMIDQWLRPGGQTLERLNELLDHREPTFYAHALAA